MKKMFVTALTTALLLTTAAVPAFAQNSTQAAAPAAASVVNHNSISAQSTYFWTNFTWNNVSGASIYHYTVYKNGSLLESGTQGITGRSVGTEQFQSYKVVIRAVNSNGVVIASATEEIVALTPTTHNLILR